MEMTLLIGLDAASYILTLLLVCIGLVIIFGMMNVINLAHGEFFLLGAYTVVLLQQYAVPFAVILVVAFAVVALVGLIIEELVIRRIYRRFPRTARPNQAPRTATSRRCCRANATVYVAAALLRHSLWPVPLCDQNRCSRGGCLLGNIGRQSYRRECSLLLQRSRYRCLQCGRTCGPTPAIDCEHSYSGRVGPGINCHAGQ